MAMSDHNKAFYAAYRCVYGPRTVSAPSDDLIPFISIQVYGETYFYSETVRLVDQTCMKLADRHL